MSLHAAERERYEILNLRAAAGDLKAALACAGRELAGLGTQRDRDKAIRRTRAAAAAGDTEALRVVAAYDFATGVILWTEARVRLEQACDAGDVVAGELLASAGVEGAGQFPVPSLPEVVSASPYVAFIEGFLTPFECLYVIAKSRGSMQQSVIVDAETGLQRVSEVRVSDTKFWRPWELDIVLHRISSRIADAFGAAIDNLEPISVVRYGPGGKFFAHLDAFKNHERDIIDDSLRLTTSIVYLNEGYAGGETAFLGPRLKISGVTGDLLHFRNVTDAGDIDEAALHAGLPVTDGEKWVLVQWERRGPLFSSTRERDADSNALN